MSLPRSFVRLPSNVLSSGSRAVATVATAAGTASPPVPYFTSSGPARVSSVQWQSLAVSTPVSDPTLVGFYSTSSHLDKTLPGGDPQDPESERKVKLGKTLRIIQKHLPTLLESPLPQEILAPNISLHLFPSTHPYLPAVSGRMAYTAALWTSPLAWNRIPIIGNLKIQVLSERMTNQQLYFSPQRSGAYPEQLVVKWRTVGKTKSSGGSDSTTGKDAGASPGSSLTEQGERNMDDFLRGTEKRGAKKEFTGLFIFEFDKEGRIISHTIERVDQGGEWEKGVGAKVVHLTDWLLGEIKGRPNTPQGACCSFQRVSRPEDQDPRSPQARLGPKR